MRIYPLAFINITNVKGVLIMPRKLTHEEFINRQINDNIKTQFCIDNNIQFIRIRYDENHVEILNNLVRNIK